MGTDERLRFYSTQPTKEQVLAPETLLKKRKTSEKTIEERKAAAVERKKVSSIRYFCTLNLHDAQHTTATSPKDDAVVS
jgi:hypothetical protein